MAGTSRYQRAYQVLLGLKESQGSPVSLNTLKSAIITELGSDEKRTVLPYLQMMRDVEMIKETIYGWEILVKDKQIREDKK